MRKDEEIATLKAQVEYAKKHPAKPSKNEQAAPVEAEKELDMQWKSYTDFWKIVGRHSIIWEHPKTETISLLRDWIDKEVNKAVLKAELKARTDTMRIYNKSFKEDGAKDEQ